MKKHSKHTVCVHEGGFFDEFTGGTNTPVFGSTSYRYLDMENRIYPRYFNTPNQQVIEKKLAALEQTEDSIFFSSGMAAISTLLFTFMGKGDHAIFQHGLYGGTTHFVNSELERFGLEYSTTSSNLPEEFEKLIRPNTRLIYIETPSNPLLGITGIEIIAQLARKHNLLTVIDNTFASPINQNPALLGVDLVMHSATKYIGGHSDICAGAVAGNRTLIEKIRSMAQNLGGSLNAQDCSLIERSMKTLAIRVEKQNQNALYIAGELEKLPDFKRVYYPGLESHPGHGIAKKQMSGFGGMVSFDLAKIDATVFQKKLKLVRPSMSLGGVDTIICSPALTSHRHLSPEARLAEGISESTLRLSVGIEDPLDILHDLKDALLDWNL